MSPSHYALSSEYSDEIFRPPPPLEVLLFRLSPLAFIEQIARTSYNQTLLRPGDPPLSPLVKADGQIPSNSTVYQLLASCFWLFLLTIPPSPKIDPPLPPFLRDEVVDS